MADINLDSASFFKANPLITPSLITLTSPDTEIASSKDGGEHWVLSNNKKGGEYLAPLDTIYSIARI